MSRYEFKCMDCKNIYRCSIPDLRNNIWNTYNRKGVDKAKCTKCKSTKKITLTAKSSAVIGDKMENFDYRAKTNMSRAEGERRAAEKLAGTTVSPYQDYYDQSGLDEGIHDNENGIVL